MSWQVYQNMDDNFTDNSVAGFKPFRDAYHERAGARSRADRSAGCRRAISTCCSTTSCTSKLPQVSWIVATAEGSEHPGPSSPAQGADYTARVLDALTANPEVWSEPCCS